MITTLIFTLIIFCMIVLSLDFFIRKYKGKLNKQNISTLVLTEDIAKQLIDRCYNDFNHHSTLYAAHIAVFITIFMIMIGFNSYDFDFNIIQYNVSKQNADIHSTIPIDNETMNSHADTKDIRKENIFIIKFVITCFFMIIYTLVYLSMAQEFVILANIKELIKLLEYKLNIPYSNIIEKGHYALTWTYIGVYKGINKVILTIIFFILFISFLLLYDSMSMITIVISMVIIIPGILRLFSVLMDTIEINKYK